MRYSVWFFRSMILICITLSAWSGEIRADEVTTFYVVRHAERGDEIRQHLGNQVPIQSQLIPLNADGMQRAIDLRELMRAEGIQLGTVYATQTVRTWQTAQPSAKASGVTIAPYAFPLQIGDRQAFIQTWKTRHAGGDILVIGHSNTVGPIVEAFGGNVDPPIGNDFNNLFVIAIRNGQTSIVRRTFGAIQFVGEVEVANPIENRNNISGIAVTPNGHLILVGDESNHIQVLLKDGAGYKAQPAIAVGPADADEMDFEGIASHGNTYFVVGSHSWRRKQIYGRHTQRPEAERRERFEEESPDRERSREQVIRLELNPVTHQLANSPTLRDLNRALRTHKVTKPFYGMPGQDIPGIPSKENGVDIEGIAFDGTDLYVGLRGPVLRWNFVPVLVVNFEQLDSASVRYVQLGGRGIRDLVRVPNGFLILAGPNGDEPLSYELYFWNGKDCFPGVANRPSDNLILLGTILAPAGAKAEGLAVLSPASPQATHYDMLVVYDGAPNGGLRRFKVLRPKL